MDRRICQNKGLWKDNGNFLQSWDWGEFQQTSGKEVVRLQIVHDESVVGQVQGIVTKLGFGVSYVYMPKFPILDAQCLSYVYDFLKEEGYSFVRIEPVRELQDESHKMVGVKNRQPQYTRVLGITKPEEELLAGMHRKTRYNIRLAEKKGVEVRREKNIDVFWKLNQQTARRDGFTSHDKEYYAKMIEMNMCHQLTAYFEDVPVASNICIAHGDMFTYLHGASGSAHRNVMAPYLLQLKGMQLARELGCTQYDFWGIAPPREKSDDARVSCSHNLCWDNTDSLAGVTRFKAGFGGETVSYPGAVDIIFSPLKYRIYSLAKKVL